MRPPLGLLAAVAVVMAACGGSALETPPPATATDTAITTVPGADPADSLGATTTVATETSTTTATSTETTSPSTTIPLLEDDEPVCTFYADVVLSETDRSYREALRRLSVVYGFPRPPDLATALDVLRGRSDELSPDAARAVLDDALGDLCRDLKGSVGGPLEGLLEAAVLLAGPDGVRVLDGSVVVPADSVGTYFAAFDDRAGGVVSLLEIRGLEIVDYRPGTGSLPTDLLLGEDLWLQDAASIAGVNVGVVTIWETGDYGGQRQFLDLIPLDGSAVTRVGAIGDLSSGAESVSFAGGRFLITESSNTGHRIYPLGADGEEIDLPGLPVLADSTGNSGGLRFARFAPDGESFAYLRVMAGGGADIVRTDVVLQRVGDGLEFMSIQIGGLDERFSSLDYDGHRVIVTGRDSLIVVDTWGLEGPELDRISLPNVEFASFLDSGVAFGP